VVDVVAHRPPAPDDTAALRSLATEARAHDGHPALGDSVWRDLANPSPESVVFVARSGDELLGALHLAPRDNQNDAANAPATLSAALVVHPGHRDRGIERALIDAAISEVARRGGGRVVLWIFGADEAADALAADAGFTPERELQQLRVRLPIAEQPDWPPGIDVRAFRPGIDDDAWLAVNNRTFAADPDQGGWTHDTLRPRLAEPWFEPAGFLMAWDADGLAGFCWTKVHPSAPPEEPDALGEIYVIGVDPDRQGSGLGRALVVGGLEWLHAHGTPVGMLFVDAANTPAVGLYRALGFDVARRDRAYSRDVS
jgi:mycothiol synthase